MGDDDRDRGDAPGGRRGGTTGYTVTPERLQEILQGGLPAKPPRDDPDEPDGSSGGAVPKPPE